MPSLATLTLLLMLTLLRATDTDTDTDADADADIAPDSHNARLPACEMHMDADTTHEMVAEESMLFRLCVKPCAAMGSEAWRWRGTCVGTAMKMNEAEHDSVLPPVCQRLRAAASIQIQFSAM